MSKSAPSVSSEERLRGIPVESGRIKSSASAPTCGFSTSFKAHPATESESRLRRSLRHRNPARVHRNRTLNLHLDRRSHIQLHIVPALQQRPPNSRRRSHARSHPRPIHPAPCQPSRRRPADGSVNPILGSVFHFLPSLAVLLNRPFRILHRLVIRPRRVLHRP